MKQPLHKHNVTLLFIDGQRDVSFFQSLPVHDEPAVDVDRLSGHLS